MEYFLFRWLTKGSNRYSLYDIVSDSNNDSEIPNSFLIAFIIIGGMLSVFLIYLNLTWVFDCNPIEGLGWSLEVCQSLIKGS